MTRSVPAVLSIAGSDSGGGAGIQADLKAFARCGVHGMTAITALTAQNTLGVTGVHPVPGEFIVEQVRAVEDDIGVDAVKIGMLGTKEIVVLYDGDGVHLIPGERHPDGAAHGSGCTHSSALAAHLALGHSPLEAARAAREIAAQAVRDGLRGIGAGAGPVHVLGMTANSPTGRYGARSTGV
jgi:hydroxymethylpyrimidine/phosphomethylpyrimidine kinase